MQLQSRNFWQTAIPQKLRRSYVYLAVHLVTVLAVVLFGWFEPETGLLMAYSGGLVAIGIADTQTRLIPDPFIVFCAALAVAYHAVTDGVGAVTFHVIFAAAFTASLMCMFLLIASTRLGFGLSRKGAPSPLLGFGDLKLIAVGCLLLSPADIFASVILAGVLMLIVRSVLSTRMSNPVTLATYLSPAFVLMVIQLRLGI